jgi:hypothetical protein
MKIALISFHNISFLERCCPRAECRNSFVSITPELWRGTLLGSLILICRASSLGSRNRTAHAAVSPARSVHRSTRDDRVATQGVIMEDVRGPRSASGVALVASTFHNDGHSIRTENLRKDFPSLPAKPAASIHASSSDNSPGRRNGPQFAARDERRRFLLQSRHRKSILAGRAAKFGNA